MPAVCCDRHKCRPAIAHVPSTALFAYWRFVWPSTGTSRACVHVGCHRSPKVEICLKWQFYDTVLCGTLASSVATNITIKSKNGVVKYATLHQRSIFFECEDSLRTRIEQCRVMKRVESDDDLLSWGRQSWLAFRCKNW